MRFIDLLRQIRLDKYISLPRICVTGSQSVGKSSVIEAISGWDFMPKGDDVATRVPTILILKNIAGSSIDERENLEESEIEPYLVFEDIKDRKFSDKKEIAEQIEELQD